MSNDSNQENVVTQNNNVSNGKKGLDIKIIIIGCAVLLLIVAVVLVFVLGGDDDKDKDNGKDKNNGGDVVNNDPVNNTNPGVIEDKEQDGLKFTNASLVSTGNSATLTTNVQNTTDSDIEVRVFDIYVKDKDGNIIVQLLGYVGEVIPAGESRDIVSNVDMNLSDATDIEYKLVK